MQPIAPGVDAKPLAHATYVPRASTRLHDSTARAILNLKSMLAKRTWLARTEETISAGLNIAAEVIDTSDDSDINVLILRPFLH